MSDIRVMVGAGPALAAATTNQAPLGSVGGTGLLWWIGGLVLLIALLWFLPLFYDTRQANRWRSGHQAEILKQLIDRASNSGGELSVEDVRQLVSAMDRSPRGVNGLTSSLLALLIATLVGVAMLVSLFASNGDAGDLRKTIVTSLLAVLATISGFYFGARTAQTSTEQATKPPEARSGPPPEAHPAEHGNPPRPVQGGPDAAAGGAAQDDDTAAGTASDDGPDAAPEQRQEAASTGDPEPPDTPGATRFHI
jgi:hypothetical protein